MLDWLSDSALRGLIRSRTLRPRLILIVDRAADLVDRVARDPAGMGKAAETRRRVAVGPAKIREDDFGGLPIEVAARRGDKLADSTFCVRVPNWEQKIMLYAK
jgi:hypothetical protein